MRVSGVSMPLLRARFRLRSPRIASRYSCASFNIFHAANASLGTSLGACTKPLASRHPCSEPVPGCGAQGQPLATPAHLWRLHALAPSLLPAAEPKDSLLLLLLIFILYYMPQMRVSGVSTPLFRACSRLRSSRIKVHHHHSLLLFLLIFLACTCRKCESGKKHWRMH